MRRRYSTLELASFFAPLQLHLQPSDLLKQLPLPFHSKFGITVVAALAREHLPQPLPGFLIQLAHLDRMNLIPPDDRYDSLDSLSGFKTHRTFRSGVP
jgi:hypothetical protein